MKLEDIAQTLRCQVYRQPVKAGGKSPYLELTPDDFKSVGDLAHFAPEKPKKSIWVELSSRSEKFLLKQNDILVRMMGGLESIGTTCFVNASLERPIVPSKSLLVVRPDLKKIDPVWLFYRLSQDGIKKRLQESSAGNRPRYILNDMVRSIELEKPTDIAVKASHAAHKFFLENLWALEEKQEEEAEKWKDLATALTD